MVYALALAGMSLPLYLSSGNWENALFAALTFSPAIVFVVVFVYLTQRAEDAQAESEALTVKLEAANRELAAYAVQAEELATIQERNRLAREIHDNLGHYLTVVNVQIKAAQAVMDKDPERAGSALDKAQQLTQEGLNAVRQSVFALRESPLGGHSLPDAINALAQEMQASGIVCTFEIAGDPRLLDPRIDLTLYRTAQEALTNVRKHARASRVEIVLDYNNPDNVTLSISDNGIGTVMVEDDHRFGILGLQERVRQLGGELAIETAPGQGFRLTISLPTAVSAASEQPVPGDTLAAREES
ncbi:MAG: sensor histidine kinase [Chloroflexota bacterium]